MSDNLEVPLLSPSMLGSHHEGEAGPSKPTYANVSHASADARFVEMVLATNRGLWKRATQSIVNRTCHHPAATMLTSPSRGA
jgi:hypothetical protein